MRTYNFITIKIFNLREKFSVIKISLIQVSQNKCDGAMRCLKIKDLT